MQSREKETTISVARSPHNDDQFSFAEYPVGKRISLATICEWAEIPYVITTSTPVDIRIHTGEKDFVAAQPGLRAYCLARKFIPNEKAAAGRYILERLAHGGYEWSSREILQADYRRRKRQNQKPVSATAN